MLQLYNILDRFLASACSSQYTTTQKGTRKAGLFDNNVKVELDLLVPPSQLDRTIRPHHRIRFKFEHRNLDVVELPLIFQKQM